MIKPIKIYKSSAGSGKTYTLSKNYIRLAIKNRNNFKKILAVTFTNKAAEEMKSRILEMIDSIASGEDKDLIIELSKFYGSSPQDISIRAKKLKTNILHHYSYFNVTTIDSFFYSIIQSFTRDLKFKGKYNIEMDLEFVINEVVSSFLADLQKDNKITKWLTEFSKEKIKSGKDFMIDGELKNITKNLFTEQYKSLPKSVEETSYKDQIAKLRKTIIATKKRFEKEAINISCDLIRVINENSYDEKDFNYGLSGVFGFIYKNSKGEIKYPSKRILACYKNPDKWVNKKRYERDNILKTIESDLINLFNKLINHYESSFRLYNSSDEINNNLYTYGILSELDLRVTRYRDDNNVILISDISELLYEVIKDEFIPFVFEKVGNTYSHYLIDEFQDTSLLQWKNFICLISDSVASGDENIFVGDTKQSIYRWRGSNPKIMDSELESFFTRDIIELKSLNKNWRSSEEIVKFNNNIFSNISNCFEDDFMVDNLSMKFNSDIIQEIRDDKKGEGYVEVNFRDRRNDKLDSVNSFLIDRINKIQDNGFSAGDIGVIVRDNKEANIIAGMLSYQAEIDNKYDYGFVSADALEINTSPIVNFFISIFKYFKNFKDRLSLSEILHFYHIYIIESDDVIHYSLSNEEKLKLLPDSFRENKLKISRLPIYELVEELIRVFKLNLIPSQIPYLKAFQDIIIEYKTLQGEESSSFLEWWEKNGKRKLNMTPQENEIQIITIHKSKGLEFSNVILPFFDWDLDNVGGGNREKILWVDLIKYSDEFDFHFPIKYKRNEQNSVFNTYYQNEKIKAYEDNINLMYVSFTRPKDNLFILAGEQRKEIKNVSDLLYNILRKNNKTNNYKYGGISKKKFLSNTPSRSLLSYPSFSWRERLIIKTTEDKMLNINNIERGKVLHDILSQIDNMNDYNEKISSALKNKKIKKNDFKLLQDLFKNKNFIKFFNPEFNSHNEIEILSDKGNVYRLDRVVETDNSVYVLDYKTGKINKEDHTQYLKKLELYMSLLESIYNKSINGYLVYIDKNQIIND